MKPTLSLLASAVLAVATIVGMPGRAVACSCAGTMIGWQPGIAYWAAAAVFLGTAVASREEERGKDSFARRVVTFQVEEAFRGADPGTLEVRTGMGGGDCGYNFEIGSRYVVYASKNEKTGSLYAGICLPPKLASEAARDLDYARRIAMGEQGATLYGIAIRNTHTDVEDYEGHDPMSGLKVTVEGSGSKREVLTDAEGRFEIGGLPPAVYRVTPEALGLRGLEPQTIDLSNSRASGVEFVATSLARVRGTLQGREGQPLNEVTISLVPTRGPSDRALDTSSQEDGAYIFDPVPPGSYYVVVAREGDPAHFQAPYRRIYHPGTDTTADATVITVKDGDDVQIPAFSLPPPLAKLSIQGSVADPKGTPVRNAVVALSLEGGYAGNVQTNEKGRFAIEAYDGVQVWVTAHGEVDGRRMHAEPIRVTLSKEARPLRLVLVHKDSACDACRAKVRAGSR
jgi:hypothetical protein